MAKKKFTDKSEPKKNAIETEEPKKDILSWLKGLPDALKITIASSILLSIAFWILNNSTDWFKEPLPEFFIVNISCNPDSTGLIVKAANSSAQKDNPLIFTIDGFFYETDYPIENKDNSYWNIQLLNLNLPESVRKEGIHQVRFGFEQNKMSIPHNINFDRTPPQMQITFEGSIPGEKKITGKVFDEAPIDSQPISVEMAFLYQENLQTVSLPVKTVIDEDGRQIHEFEYEIQNIPKYAQNDPQYEAPFFALKVKDAAGNEFFEHSTYNDFIGTGKRTFGNRNAQVTVQKVGGETPEIQRMKIKVPQSSLKTMDKFASGPPLIKLRVVIRTPYYVMLSWNRLPENLRQQPQAYTIRRGGKPIGSSYDTTFTDQTVDSTTRYSYQVQATGRNDLTYLSNEATAKKPEMQRPLRSTPTTLDSTQVKLMLQNKRFFDIRWNKNAPGWNNQFVPQTNQGDKVVMDRSTGLMWQQSGSPGLLYWKDVQKWIDDLNRKGYAGFHNWRLPTLEEAMSLMEPKRRNADLYIDPVFDNTQRWIWTADQVAGGSLRWVVSFANGHCFDYSIYILSYVRLVRSGQSYSGE